MCNVTCIFSYRSVVDQHVTGQVSLSWTGTKSVQEWLDGQPQQSWKQTFEQQGVLVSFI